MFCEDWPGSIMCSLEGGIECKVFLEIEWNLSITTQDILEMLMGRKIESENCLFYMVVNLHRLIHA